MRTNCAIFTECCVPDCDPRAIKNRASISTLATVTAGAAYRDIGDEYTVRDQDVAGVENPASVAGGGAAVSGSATTLVTGNGRQRNLCCSPVGETKCATAGESTPAIPGR